VVAVAAAAALVGVFCADVICETWPRVRTDAAPKTITAIRRTSKPGNKLVSFIGVDVCGPIVVFIHTASKTALI
jgi:hypothetical protein